MADVSTAQQALRDIRREFRELVHRYPEAKAKAKEATSSDAWGPTSEQKLELVKIACNHSEDRELIYRAVFKRLADDTKFWMHSCKAMDILEYFLFLEVPDIIPRLHQHRERLAQLQTYHAAEHEDPVRQQQLNHNVRGKAARLLRLMDDPAFQAEEAQKVLTMMTRLSGGGATTLPVPAAVTMQRSKDTSPAPAPALQTRTTGQAPQSSGIADVYREDDDDDVPTGRKSDRGQFIDHKSASPPQRQHVAEAAATYHLPQEQTTPSLFSYATTTPAAVATPQQQYQQSAPTPTYQATATTPPVRTPTANSVDLFSQPPQRTVPNFAPPHTAPTQPPLFGAPAATPVPVQQQAPPASAPVHQAAPAVAPRPPPPQGFDPFAEITAVMKEEQQRKSTNPGPAVGTHDDFFSAPATAQRPVEFVPAPQNTSTQGSSRASPVPSTGDRMTDYMFSQLDGLQVGKKTAKGETQSLDALLHNRPSH